MQSPATKFDESLPSTFDSAKFFWITDADERRARVKTLDRRRAANKRAKAARRAQRHK